MKRLISILTACVVLACSMFVILPKVEAFESIPVSAAEISPYFLYANNSLSSLSISGKTATCISSVSGPSITKISATQYLEIKSGSSWSPVAIWGQSANSSSMSMTRTKSGLAKGTYRLRTVFTVYAGSYSKSETITATSASRTVS